MNNRYSLTLLAIMASMLLAGVVSVIGAVFVGSWLLGIIGTVPFVLGGMMFLGLKELSAGKPKEGGLITFFGKRTDTYVEGLVLLLDWLPFDVVGVIVFEMQVEALSFPIEDIRCSCGGRVKGRVDISIELNPELLGVFDDYKRLDGIKKQLDGIFINAVQEIARIEGHDYKWMESNPLTIGRTIIEETGGFTERQPGLISGTGKLARVDSMGIIITRLQVILVASSPKIVAADEEEQIEKLQQNTDRMDTATLADQALDRYYFYHPELRGMAGTVTPDPEELKECMEEVTLARLIKAGKVSVTKGGQNVNVRRIDDLDATGGVH